ncbi:hypothetical protein D3C72_949870 [compost metagenome]
MKRQARIGAAIQTVLEQLLRQPRIDGGGADPDQNGEGVGVQGLGGPHDQRAIGAQTRRDQAAMRPGGGQDHRRGQTLGRGVLVGQDDQGGALARGDLGLVADAIERLTQSGAGAVALGRNRIGAVDHRGRAVGDDAQQALIHAGGQDRAVQDEDLGLGLVLGQDVAQVLEAGLQAHGPGFAQGVDGRVGDLAEVLAEVVGQGARQAGQDGGRGVVAHGADRLLAVADQGVQQQVQILAAETGGDLAADQGLADRGARLGSGADDGLQIDHVVEPVRIGLGGGEGVDGLMLVVEAAMLQIDGDQLAGADVQAALDAALGQGDQTGFGAGQQQAVHSFHGAQGAQAVAVLAGHDPAAVDGAQGGGAVPRLHHRVAVGVEGAVLGLHHHVVRGPGLGHQQGLGQGGGAPGADQNLEHIVQRRRVRAARLDHRLDLMVAVAEGRGRHADLVGAHPVQVALKRVDLAVVGQHAEGLGQLPLGEGVGRVALVEDGVAGDDGGVVQVVIQLAQQLGADHALVDDGAGRQGAEVEAVQTRRLHRLFDAAATQEELALQFLDLHAFRRGQHDLLDLGPGGVGADADDGQVHRRLAPAVDVEARADGLGLDDGAGVVLGAQVGARQEDLADRDGAGTQGLADGAHLGREEGLGQFDHDAGAVAGQAVGVDRAAVGHGLQRLDGHVDDLAPGLAVDGADQTHAAGVAFRRRVIGAAFDQPGAVGFILGQPVGLRCVGHAAASSVRARR